MSEVPSARGRARLRGSGAAPVGAASDEPGYGAEPHVKSVRRLVERQGSRLGQWPGIEPPGPLLERGAGERGELPAWNPDGLQPVGETAPAGQLDQVVR